MDIRTGLATGLIAAAVLAFAPVGAQAENLNPHLLGAGCVVCHGPGGESRGHTPAIHEMSAKVIGARMQDFKNDRRANTIMAKIAKGYTDKQIDVLANYFGAN